MASEKLPPAKQHEALLETLKTRFEKNMVRHEGWSWKDVLTRLEMYPELVWSLAEMERTGGEPDATGFVEATGEAIFCDCSAESPKGRRSLCFDDDALEGRKEHKPEGNAVGTAAAMGIEILSEEDYRALQKLGEFDLKTSSWVKTPGDIRAKGGALFCDRRYGRVFLYHNGAESYYGARGFRGTIRI